LTVVLTEAEVEEIVRRAAEYPDYHLAIDLEQQKVHDDHGFSASFQVDEFTRHCLLEGLDDIGLTLQHDPEITAYEARHPVSQKIM
jgi:3-isopropylmalate/(R)-2-methylmalate dehydratase small subunit